jgi:di/tricarboxylate transporter
MTPAALYVFGVLAVTVALFMSDRLRLDLVALLSLLALTLGGILTAEEALSGFSDPVVLMIAGLFVVGDGLFHTGVARTLGRLPARLAGDSEVGLLVVIMVLVALLSGVMSSTGTVAVMLPVVMGLAWGRNISPSKLLIPLSIASLLGGMLTLIGTAPNIVVSRHLESLGREGFGMFDFTPLGVVLVLTGVTFMALVGRHLLPARPSPARPTVTSDTPTVAELFDQWELPPSTFRVSLPAESPLVGRSLEEADLPGQFGVTVTEILPGPRPAMADTLLEAGDSLLLTGSADGVHRLVARFDARLEPTESMSDPMSPETGIAEVLLTPRSRFLGKTLAETRFRDRFQLGVVAVKRLGELVPGDLRHLPFRFGDTLLVQGPWEKIRGLDSETRDFVVAMAPREMSSALAPLGRAPVAIGIMILMMAALTLGLLPPVTAVLTAAVAMVLTGCVSAEEAYRAINWQSVVLIAGILPMATALERSGGMAWLVAGLSSVLDDQGPLLLMAAVFLLASTLSQVISNTATAVLLAPIASSLALGIGARPEPFLMTLAVAASTAFATPVASPVNTLVLGPGGYRFGDFFKVGVLLQLIILVLTLILVPRLFPF